MASASSPSVTDFSWAMALSMACLSAARACRHAPELLLGLMDELFARLRASTVALRFLSSAAWLRHP